MIKYVLMTQEPAHTAFNMCISFNFIIVNQLLQAVISTTHPLHA